MSLQNVTFNMSSAVRYDRMEGRDYLVAPMVMITEGVHNGSGGSLYYPKEELQKTPEVWNYKPVVVYHPTMNGVGVSACDPTIISSRKVGVIMNTKYDKESGKLRAEAWLEKDRVQEVDDRILASLENNEIMELSTGLFTDNERTDGEWQGERYTHVARNYRPDHLALLPDKVGACSVADGAGLLQLNAEQKSSLEVAIQNEFGQETILKEIVTSQVICQNGDDLFQVDCSFEDNTFLINADSRVNVNGDGLKDGQVGDTVPVTIGESEMAKTEIVDGLIDNDATSFSEEDREQLLELNEELLQKIEPVVNDDPEEPAAEEDDSVEEEAVAEEAPAEEAAEEAEEVVDNNSDALTVEEYIANAPEGIRDMLKAGLAAHQRDRQDLIDVVVANEKNIFSEAQLNSKSIDELQGLAALAGVEEEPVANAAAPSYAGAAAPAPVRNAKDGEEQPLLIPTMNWSRE